MYCLVIFQKRLSSVFDESYIPVFSGRITLSIGENRMKIRAVVFEIFMSRQTDAAEDFVLYRY